MKHKLNFAKECLSIGECVCCHKRNDHIVIGDGRCTDCVCDGIQEDPQMSKNQRDYGLGVLNMTLGMLMIVVVEKVFNHPVHPIIPQLILWFVGVSCLVGLFIHIYNLINKS